MQHAKEGQRGRERLGRGVLLEVKQSEKPPWRTQLHEEVVVAHVTHTCPNPHPCRFRAPGGSGTVPWREWGPGACAWQSMLGRSAVLPEA